jgi:copper chaperone NosL
MMCFISSKNNAARRVYTAWIVVAVTVCQVACNKESPAGKGPTPAVQGIGTDGALHPDPSDRCPVCAMTVHDKKFGAAIVLDDGRTFYFCGPGCMIRSWMAPQKHLGTDPSHLKSATATEYFTGKPVDAQTAIWVAGSDVSGPMGPMPVALSDDASAKTFLARHGGKSTFRLKDMTPEKWQAMKKKPSP